jgi:hypothetical protein
MRKKIFLHLGYPKTATSALQKYVFPSLESVCFLGKYEGQVNKFSIKGLEQLLFDVSTHSFEDFKSLKPDCNCLELLEDNSLISEEVILFNILRPTLWKSNSVRFSDVLSNLKYIESMANVEFKIIMTIRKQTEMITSVYAQCYNSCYSRIGDLSSFEMFLKCFISDTSFSSILKYDQVLLELRKEFDDVYLAIYEEIQNGAFFEILSSIFDEKIDDKILKKDNVRSGKGYKKVDDFTLSDLLGSLRHKIPFMRHVKMPMIRKLLHKVKVKKMDSISKQVVLSDEELALIQKYYKESNCNIEKEAGVDLASLGYYK